MPTGQSVLDLPSDLSPLLTDYVHTFDDTARDSKVTLEDVKELIAPPDLTTSLALTASEKGKVLKNVDLKPLVCVFLAQSNGSRVGSVNGSGVPQDPIFGLPDYDAETMEGVYVLNDRIASPAWEQWDVTLSSSQTLSTAGYYPSTTPFFHLAKQIKRKTGRDVYCILAAEGGRSLSYFSPGGSLYLRLVANLAAGAVTEVDEVVFIQGEANNSNSEPVYTAALQVCLDGLRALPEIKTTTPITFTELNHQFSTANAMMEKFADENSFIRYATGSKHLPMLSDGIHFTNNSAVAIGKAVMYDALQQPSVSPNETPLSRATATTGDQYVTLGSGALSSFTGDFTYMMRFRLNYGGKQDIVDYVAQQSHFELARATAATTCLHILQLASGQLRIYVDSTSYYTACTIPNHILDENRTFVLTITRKASDGIIGVYLNGVALAVTTTGTTPVGTLTAPTAGRIFGEVNGTKRMAAECKFVAMWSRLLTTTELAATPDTIYSLASTPVFAHPFTTPPKGLVKDKSGNGFNGTWVGTGAYMEQIR